MVGIDELLIAIGIEEGSTLEELYIMLKEIQGAGGDIKIKLPDDLPTRGQITNIYRRISEMENKVIPRLSEFPQLIDKVKEYIVDMYDDLKFQCVKDEVQEIQEIVRKILSKFPIYKRDVTIAFNKVSEMIESIKQELENPTEDRSEEYYNSLSERMKNAKSEVITFLLGIMRREDTTRQDMEEIYNDLKAISINILESNMVLSDRILENQEDMPREIIKTEIVRKLFKTEIPTDLPIVGDPTSKETVIDSLLESLTDIIMKKASVEKGLDIFRWGPGTQMSRGATREQRNDIAKLLGAEWQSWRNEDIFTKTMIDKAIRPFLEKEMSTEDPNEKVREVLLESVNNLNENVEFTHKLLRQLRAGFQNTQQFEKKISEQITMMDSRVKIIQENTEKEPPEDENLKKDASRKGVLE